MTALPHDPADERQGSFDGHLRSAAELARLMGFLHDLGKVSPEFKELLECVEATSSEATGNVRPLGRARKVSVSMPEELTAAVQQRVGRGEFSQYVTEAVAWQLELDLLNELATLLEAEHGPVSEEFLAEAGAAWSDAG